MVDLAVKLDIIQKSGSWFSMGEERIGQGRDSAKKYLKDNPEICERVEAEIRQNSFKLMSAQSQAAARAAGRAPQEETEAQGEAQEAAPEEAVPLPEEPPEGKPEGKLTVPKGVDVSADDFDDDAP